MDVDISYAMKHICYGASMVSKGIMGIFDVNKRMDIIFITGLQEKAEVTLRAVLYRLKLQDNSSLVGEVHQATAMSPVDVAVANTEEASKMIEMMKKNVAAFLFHVSLEWDMDDEFIKRLLSKAVNPKLVADIDNPTSNVSSAKKTTMNHAPIRGERV